MVINSYTHVYVIGFIGLGDSNVCEAIKRKLPASLYSGGIRRYQDTTLSTQIAG